MEEVREACTREGGGGEKGGERAKGESGEERGT